MLEKTYTLRGGRPGEKRLEEAREERALKDEYFGAFEDYATSGLESSQNVLERELARLRMRLGYQQSMGAGTAGRWNLARGSMLNAGAQQQMQLQNQWEMWKADQAKNWAIMQDQQKHAERMAMLQYQYNMELMKQQAELNDSSWWETLGTIVGYAGMLWGWAGFPWFGGGTTAATGSAGASAGTAAGPTAGIW